tara:strand:- start:2210 stop:2542 length:333 start_codon:yes stop_codon:yes gene_type:complete
VFVDEGIAVVLRVAQSEPAAWLTRRFEGRRPKCQRWGCDTCREDDCEAFASSKPYFVIQTQGANGWEDWFFPQLEAGALLVVQQGLPEIRKRGTFSDCAAASEEVSVCAI